MTCCIKCDATLVYGQSGCLHSLPNRTGIYECVVKNKNKDKAHNNQRVLFNKNKNTWTIDNEENILRWTYNTNL